MEIGRSFPNSELSKIDSVFFFVEKNGGFPFRAVNCMGRTVVLVGSADRQSDRDPSLNIHRS